MTHKRGQIVLQNKLFAQENIVPGSINWKKCKSITQNRVNRYRINKVQVNGPGRTMFFHQLMGILFIMYIAIIIVIYILNGFKIECHIDRLEITIKPVYSGIYIVLTTIGHPFCV